MSDTAAETPTVTPATVQGPAYGMGYKRLLVALLLLLSAWGLRLALQPETWQINRDVLLWGLSGYVLLLYMGRPPAPENCWRRGIQRQEI